MGECGCIFVGGYDPPEMFSEKIIVARKTHICGECERKIKHGEKYENVRGKWYGNWNTHKTCLDCVSVRDKFFCDEFAFGTLWRKVREHIHQMQGNISSSCFGGLTRSAKNMLCNEIDSVHEEINAFEENEPESERC